MDNKAELERLHTDLLTAIKQNDVWKIDLFQNTPAQFHGKPEMLEKLTKTTNRHSCVA